MPGPPKVPSHLDPVLTLHVGDGSSSVGGVNRKSVLGDKGKLSSITGLCLVETTTETSRTSSSSTRSRTRQQAGPRNAGSGSRVEAADSESASAGDSSEDEEEDDSDDDDNDAPLRFQCRQLLGSARQRVSVGLSVREWRGRRLVSCHANGESFVWDLERQKVQNEFCANRGGPGLALRRMAATTHACLRDEEQPIECNSSSPRVMYQTRDPAGTVSVHQFRPDGTITQLQSIHTQSQSFCAASPCANDPNLLVVPDGDETAAVVRDVRVNPASPPAAVICISQIKPPPSSSLPASMDRRYGMLTSLAFAVGTCPSQDFERPTTKELFRIPRGGSGKPVVACGMESGHVLLYDLAATTAFARPVSVVDKTLANEDPSSVPPLWLDEPSAFIALGKDPVLALDMVHSFLPAPRSDSSLSMVIAAGMAGTLEDVTALDRAEQGRVALIKCRYSIDDSTWTTRIRSRFATCHVPDNLRDANHPNWIGRGGKPGVSQCRFRPGAGRLVAVAGWDKRVRIFDRSAKASSRGLRADYNGSSAGPSPAALAVLRGHTTTVTAIDWASDAEASGLLATGGEDGRIHVWKLDL